MIHSQPLSTTTTQFFTHRRPIAIGILIGLVLILLLPTVGQAQSTCPNPYIVQRGDNLTRIARRCGVDYQALRAANPQITNPSRIEVGDRITIPGASVATVTPTPVTSNFNRLLEDGTYTLVATDTGTVTLRNGQGQRPGPVGEITVQLMGPTAQGDINRDGIPDAATILMEQAANTTGRFYSLHLLLGSRQGGQLLLTEWGVTYLGDRIGVNSVTIEADGDVLLDMIAEGPNDPMMGASLLLLQTYRLQGDQLPVVAARPKANSGANVVCPGTYPTRLSPNGRAYVLPEPPLSNRVRTTPSRQGRQIGSAQPWEGMTILTSHHCADGWIWWYVETDEGLTGWISEGEPGTYWLQPGDPAAGSVDPLPTPTSIVTPPNGPTITDVTVCTALDTNKRCLPPYDNLPADLQRVYVNWYTSGLPLGTQTTREWYYDGTLVHSFTDVAADVALGNGQGFGSTFYDRTDNGGFAQGNWQLVFRRTSNGVMLGYHNFTIAADNNGSASPAPATGFTGTWQTNFATMTLTQNGTRVTGSYTRYSRTVPTTLTGTVSNGILRGTNERGTAFTFRLNADGTSFSGEWIGNDGQSYPWCGVHSGPLPAGCGFSGTWNTNHRTGGWVELAQIGDTVNGRYYNGSTYGTLDGTFELFGTTQLYSMAGSYQANNNANDRGFFRFSLPNLDSAQFQGCWRNTTTGNAGNWCGWPGAVGSCPQVSSCQ